VIEDGLGTVNTVGGTYIAYRLSRGLKALQKKYADAGWLDATVGTPHASEDGRGHVRLTIPVHAGTRFTIGTIRAIGAGADARAAVIDAMGLHEGAYYDRATVRAGVERAQRVLDRRIQLRVNVAPERSEIDVDAIVEAP
jgi:outer membrane protein assembly factor BamA